MLTDNFMADKFPVEAEVRAEAQEPVVPVEAIGKILAEVMGIAVSNGANSVSMPDEYVEVAAWLSGIAPQPPAPCPNCLGQEPDDLRLRDEYIKADRRNDSGRPEHHAAAALAAEVRRLQSEVERLPARRAQPTVKTAPIAPPNLAFFGIAETDEEFAERAGRKVTEVER